MLVPCLCGPASHPRLLLFYISQISIINIVVSVINVVVVLLCVFPPSSFSLKADGRPPRAPFCSMLLPVKGEFFLAAVAKHLLTGTC